MLFLRVDWPVIRPSCLVVPLADPPRVLLPEIVVGDLLLFFELPPLGEVCLLLGNVVEDDRLKVLVQSITPPGSGPMGTMFPFL